MTAMKNDSHLNLINRIVVLIPIDNTTNMKQNLRKNVLIISFDKNKLIYRL